MPQDIARDKLGIPLKSGFPDGTPVFVFVCVINCVFLCIGTGVSYAIYTRGDRFHYDSKIQILASLGLGWMYCGLVAFKVCSMGISIVAAGARKLSKVFGGPDTQGYVTLAQEGAIGRFNRAQRAHFNHLESLPYVILVWFFASFVFPFPAFVVICIFALARIHFTVGYANAPQGRDAGQQICYLCISVIEGMCMVAGVMIMMRQL